MATAQRKDWLVQWVLSLYGPGKKFRSRLELSRAADINEANIRRIEERGSAGPEIVGAIADAAGFPRAEAFAAMGWLRDSEVSEASRISGEALSVAQRFDHLGKREKAFLLDTLALLERPTSPTA